MHGHWREYDELHTLSWDIRNSACGECEYVNDCKYYTAEGCPNQREESL